MRCSAFGSRAAPIYFVKFMVSRATLELLRQSEAKGVSSEGKIGAGAVPEWLQSQGGARLSTEGEFGGANLSCSGVAQIRGANFSAPSCSALAPGTIPE